MQINKKMAKIVQKVLISEMETISKMSQKRWHEPVVKVSESQK